MNDAEAANVRAWLAGDSCSGHRKVTREKGWGGEGAGCRLGAIGGAAPGDVRAEAGPHSGVPVSSGYF